MSEGEHHHLTVDARVGQEAEKRLDEAGWQVGDQHTPNLFDSGPGTSIPPGLDQLVGVSLFETLDSKARHRFRREARAVTVRAGQWLFREGAPVDAMFVVLAGRLEVINDSTGDVIRVLGPGDTVGELAVLTASPRSASVRVRRDAALLEMARDSVERLLSDVPAIGAAFARQLARVLRDSRALVDYSARRATTVALVGDGQRVPVHRFADAVVDTLTRWQSVTRIDRATPGIAGASGPGVMVDALERRGTLVLLIADSRDPCDEWAGFCRRQADRVVVLVDDHDLRLADLSGNDVVLVQRDRAPVPERISRIQVQALYRCLGDGGILACGAAVARRLAGRSLGLVLSGGGARAFAHIGVLDELAARGVSVDRVGGASMGALIGALYAAGCSPEEIAEHVRAEFIRRNPSADYTVPLSALIRGRRASEMLERLFGATTIEDLLCEFFCVSFDLLAAERVVHRRGSLARVVGASITVPGVAPPMPIGGRLLVDGGVVDNLPIGIMADTAEGPVIAVDVATPFGGTRLPTPRAVGLRNRTVGELRAWLVGTREPLPGIAETLTRVMTFASADAAKVAERRAALTIRPHTPGTGLLQWSRLDAVRDAGRAAARTAFDLHGIPEQVPALQPDPLN